MYGRGWRRSAPQDVLLPLQLAALGVPLHLTYEAGLKAAGLPADTYAVLFTNPKSGEAAEREVLAEPRCLELEAAARIEALAEQRTAVEALAHEALRRHWPRMPGMSRLRRAAAEAARMSTAGSPMTWLRTEIRPPRSGLCAHPARANSLCAVGAGALCARVPRASARCVSAGQQP